MAKSSFGFIYREFTPWRGMFYDGDENNLKYCYDPEQAKKWWDVVKDNVKDVKIKRPPNKYFTIKVPIVPESEESTPDKTFDEWVIKSKLSLKLQAILVEFLKTHYFDWNNFVKKDAEKKIEKDQWWVLMNMKDILLGMFRISPVKIKSGFDRVTNQDTFSDWNFSQDVLNVKYNVAGRNFKTNLFGIYTPQIKRAMLWEKYDGSPLQDWQNDAWWNLWRISFIVGSRELGKSILMTAFSGCSVLKELSSPLEKERPFLIHYFGLSKEANTTVAMYIKKMMLDLIDDKRAIVWKSTDSKLVFKDGKTERIIQFKSQHDEWVGRWDRPHLVIIDEAARIDYEVYKTAINTLTAQIVCISTINYESKKNWFWDLYQASLIKQTEYEPIDELIHRLWVEAWLDKAKTKEDIYEIIDNDWFGKAKDEFFLARPMVGMKYTIENDQNKSEAQKKMLIDNAMEVGEDYCLAELFGEISDSQVIFNYEGLIEADTPMRFDYWVVAFDEAESYDNAGLVTLGVINNMAYILSSEKLSRDISDRYWQIRQTINIMKGKCVWDVLFAADITRWEAYYREITEKVQSIDFPLYYTKSTDAKYRHPYRYTGKKYLVDLSRNEFFLKANIRLSGSLSNEGWLIDELAEFKKSEKGRYEAKRGKDDQVNAMMIALFTAYQAFLKEEYIWQDKRGTMSREERIDLLRERIEQQEEQERQDRIMWYIYAEFW
jgi:hypothetical protein